MLYEEKTSSGKIVHKTFLRDIYFVKEAETPLGDSAESVLHTVGHQIQKLFHKSRKWSLKQKL